MARLRFPDDRSAYVYAAAGDPLLMPGPLPLIVYADPGCTIRADVADVGGTPLAGSTIHIGLDGLVQEFLGPADGTTALYTRAYADQPAYELFAEAGPRLDLLDDGIGRPFAYTHTQGVSAATWVISHSLGFNPAGILVKDQEGVTVLAPNVVYVNTSTLSLTFSAAFSGTAYLS